jgi:multiple sugar transport system permease protein
VATAVAPRTSASGSQSRARRWFSGFRERETWVAYVFIIPWLFGFLVLTAGPMIWSAYLSFTNYGVEQIAGFAPTESVGTQHYHELLHDEKIRLALKNTLIFALLKVPATMICALALALILVRLGSAAGFFRTVFYVPHITPPVAIGVLILVLFNGQVGLINQALGYIGINGPYWTTDPSWIKPSLAITSVWASGGTMVIYLAALHGVPQQLYEAASIDGASKWRQFRNITLPMISPALFFTFIILSIASLDTFTEAYTAYFGAGSAGAEAPDAALFYAIYLFRQSFEFFNLGYASAMAWLLFLITMIVTLINVFASKRFVFYQGGQR